MYFNIYTPAQHYRRPPVNPGGLCWIVFALWEDVLQWPQIDPQTGKAVTSIRLKDGKTWYEFKVVNKERMFTESMKVDNSGPYWESQVQGYIGGNNSNLTLNAATLQYHKFVVMFKDRDRQIRFIGNEECGASYISDYTSGDAEQGRRWNLKFGWQHAAPAPIYIGNLTGIINEPIEPPFAGQGDFHDDFNDDFNI